MGLPCGTFNAEYREDMAILRTRTHWGLAIAAIVLLFTLPSYLSNTWLIVANFIGIWIVATLGLSLLTGYCGQISLGQAGFMAAGAFSCAALVNYGGLSYWPALIVAAFFTGGIGLIFGIPSLRVKGFYLAIITLAAHFIILFVILHIPALQGTMGLNIAPPHIGSVTFDSHHNFFYLIMGVVIIMTIITKNIVRTKPGRAFIAIRDNDLAAEMMGVDVFRYKLIAFFICAVYAGLAGGLMLGYITHAHIDEYPFMDSVWCLGFLIVGGLGSVAGTIMGVVFLRVFSQLTYMYLAPLATLLMPAGMGTAGFGIGPFTYGLIIILFLIFEPRGLYHRWEIFKSWYRLWPFAY